MPHSEPVRNDAASMLAVTWRFCRYLRSYANGPLRGLSCDVVVQERGWFDQLVDPRRYRMSTRLVPIVRLLGAALPRPDSVIVMMGDASLISARKSELSVEETRRQVTQWRLLGRQWRGNLVDATSDTVEESAVKVAQAVVVARATLLQSDFRRVGLSPARLEMIATKGSRVNRRLLYRAGSLKGHVLRIFGLWPVPWSDCASAGHVAQFIAAAGISMDAAACICSQHRERFVLSTSRSGTIDRVIKVGNSSDLTIKAEAEMIGSLSGHIRGVDVPVLTESGEVGGWAFLAMRGDERALRMPRIDIVSALEVSVALASCHSGRGLTHGDFRPANLVPGTPHLLLDWEFATSKLIPGYDIGHYMISCRDRPGHLPAGDWSVDEAAVLEEYSSKLRIPQAVVAMGAKMGAEDAVRPFGERRHGQLISEAWVAFR